MLPGLRFFLAAIMLSMSILVFGLGAAALLRSAHEEVANLPIRRAPSPTIFTQHIDTPQPSLAMLRVESAPADAGLDQPAPAPIAAIDATVAVAPAADRPNDAATDQPPQSATTPETVAVIDQNQSEEAPSAAAEAPALPANADAPPAAAPQISADADPALVGTPQVVLPPEPTPRLVASGVAVTWRVASLGNPTAASEKTIAAPKATQADASKKAQARRAAKHRRALARARLLRQQQVQEKPLDPFAPFETTTTTAATTTRR